MPAIQSLQNSTNDGTSVEFSEQHMKINDEFTCLCVVGSGDTLVIKGSLTENGTYYDMLEVTESGWHRLYCAPYVKVDRSAGSSSTSEAWILKQ